MKQCKRRGHLKDVSNFNKDSQNKDGLNEYKAEYYQTNKVEIEGKKKERKIAHPEVVERDKIYQAEYRKNNKDKSSDYQKQYRQDNKEELDEYYEEWALSNKDKIKKNGKKYHQKKMRDPLYRLERNIVSVLSQMVRVGIPFKKDHLQLVPFAAENLKYHLECQFEPWMNWDNYGEYRAKTWNDDDPATWTWQIDHIIPKSLFKYSSMEDDEFRKCWSLSNLRPFSAKQNILDGNRRKIK